MNEDKIVTMLLDHEERLDRIEKNMTTKDDHREVMVAIDNLTKIVKDVSQEMVMVSHGHVRLEERVATTEKRLDGLEKDVKQMKPALGIS